MLSLCLQRCLSPVVWQRAESEQQREALLADLTSVSFDPGDFARELLIAFRIVVDVRVRLVHPVAPLKVSERLTVLYTMY